MFHKVIFYCRYLYWVMRDPLSGGGLYRTDLIEFESGCIPSEKLELIISDNHIMAFAVDYKNFRLLLPAATNNTIVSVAQDGSDVADIRENAQTPQYRNIKSMAVHQNLLYWTSDKDLFGEEYHKRENKFYQNVYSVGEGPFIALNIDHTDSQPHPGCKFFKLIHLKISESPLLDCMFYRMSQIEQPNFKIQYIFLTIMYIKMKCDMFIGKLCNF